MLQRYEQLELRIALSRKCNYAEACKELAVILRGGYNKVPKNLQALLFQDTLAAFRLLSEVGSSQGILAANPLLQAAEASLPKQKKALADTEFKHVAVALLNAHVIISHRNNKYHQKCGSVLKISYLGLLSYCSKLRESLGEV